jgi:hypothetical protein
MSRAAEAMPTLDEEHSDRAPLRRGGAGLLS